MFKLLQLFARPSTNVPDADQRINDRYPVGERCPVSVAVRLLKHDARGRVEDSSLDAGRYWKGRLLDISRKGVRIALAKEAFADRGEAARLSVGLGEDEMVVDCKVAHFARTDEYNVCGLQLDGISPAAQKTFLHLVEPIAIASTFEMVNPAKAPRTSPEFRLEHYEGSDRTQLTVWRTAATSEISAFELRLGDYAVHWSSGMEELEIVRAADGAHVEDETQRQAVTWLFCLVATSLDKRVAPDVRQFLAGLVQPT